MKSSEIREQPVQLVETLIPDYGTAKRGSLRPGYPPYRLGFVGAASALRTAFGSRAITRR